MSPAVIDKNKEEALKLLTNVIWERVSDKSRKLAVPKRCEDLPRLFYEGGYYVFH